MQVATARRVLGGERLALRQIPGSIVRSMPLFLDA